MTTTRPLIKNKAVVDDDWSVLRLAEGDAPESITVPSGKVIVPLKVWLAQREVLQSRTDIGVWLATDERGEALQDDLAILPVIAVDFPRFADGRGYTIATRLRTRFGYRGELRAIGAVLRDQLFYLQRVGFDAFDLKAGKDIQDALNGLSDYSVSYQAAADESQPLYRRVQRGVDA